MYNAIPGSIIAMDGCHTFLLLEGEEYYRQQEQQPIDWRECGLVKQIIILIIYYDYIHS